MTRRGERGGRHVLKALGRSGGELPPASLREDFVDLNMLRHPTLATTVRLEPGRHGGAWFLGRAWIEGQNLAEVLEGKKPAAVTLWLLAVAEALAVLHRAGFLHRNLKPQNIIVPRGGLRAHRVVLCDAAWWNDGQRPPGSEARGASDAPEQSAESISTPRSELFALGSTFYELLGGGLRPAAGTAVRPLRERRPEVPSDLDRVVLRLVHPDSARRPGDADAFLEDLRRIAPIAGTRFSEAPAELFVDRREQVEAAVERLDAVRPAAAIAVTGEAGSGKSALLRRLQLEVDLLGRRALCLTCFPGRSELLEEIGRGLFPAGVAGRAARRRYRHLVKPPGNSVEAGGGESPAWAPSALRRGLLDLFAELTEKSPAVVLIDDAHHADRSEVELLAALVREIAADRESAAGFGLSLVVAYRGESAYRRRLSPLLEALASPLAHHLTLDLDPLSTPAVGEWLRRVRGAGVFTDENLAGFVDRTRGNPLLIHGELSRPPDGTSVSVGDASLSQTFRSFFRTLGERDRTLLELLGLLGRPATRELLQDLVDVPLQELRRSLQRLCRDGTLREERDGLFFRHASFHDWLLESVDSARARKLRGRVAAVLETISDEDPVNIAQLWLQSSTPQRGRDVALAAARRLVAQQPRRAVELFRAALDLVEPHERRLQRSVSEEAAAASAAAGDPRAAAELLTGVVDSGERQSRSLEAIRLQAKIGIYRHRSGEMAEAVTQLEGALEALQDARSIDALRLRLRVESELAEIASNQGDYNRAERIANRALERLGESTRDLEIRRLEMVLLETLAHLCMRRFQYAHARELFERSLALGRRLDAPDVKSLVLNNLGSLHVQESRFRRAASCFEQAARHSARLGDDASLAIVHANLAVIHARCGRPDRAEAALSSSLQHESRTDSARARCIRLHSAGLVDLTFGRYRDAVENFRAAIAAGEELQDSFMVAFDWAFLGESQLLRGDTRRARMAFERAGGQGSRLPGPVGSMLDARSALLAALRGDRREASAALGRFEARAERVPAFVDAWNRLFAGWAARLCGDAQGARKLLDRAHAFFRRTRIPAGEIHTAIELAAVDVAQERVTLARRRLESLVAAGVPGEGALRNPMLSARLLLYTARALLESRQPDVQRASAAVLDAESFLVGPGPADLETLIRELRGKLREAGAFTAPPVSPTRSGGDASVELVNVVDAVAALVNNLENHHAGQDDGLRQQLREIEEGLRFVRRSMAGDGARRRSPVSVEAIVGHSAATRQLVEQVRQVANTSLPVLIRGETGAGKELVARALHGESARSAGPFVSVNCAALPEALLEVELFGSVRGAFSGAETDRPGLLRQADGGTFLFDEVSELSPALQGKLLRVLDRHSVRPVGGESESPLDVRCLFSSKRPLAELVETKKFRPDLYYRLSSFEIVVPPLRDRMEDLPELVSGFLEESKTDGPPPALDPAALRELAAYSWPGNVRELRNLVVRLALTCPGRIGAGDVRRDLRGLSEAGLFSRALLRSRPLEVLLAQLEREYLVQLFRDTRGDMAAMSQKLGITTRALYARLRRLELRPRELKRLLE